MKFFDVMARANGYFDLDVGLQYRMFLFRISDFGLRIFSCKDRCRISVSGFNPKSEIRNPKFSRLHFRPAFTLLEVILAIGLTLILITTVLVFNRQTSNIRASIIEDVHVVSSQRLVMQRLTDELRGAMIYPFLSMGLQGQSDPITGDQMKFFVASLPGQTAWAVRSATEDAIPLQADQEIVSYRLRIARDEQGQPLRDDAGNIIVEGLERTCQKVLSSTAQEGQEITVTLLTQHIKFFMLRYWDGTSWVGSWSSADLPLAVEITLGDKPLLADEAPEEYSHEFSRRVVFLPGGTKAMNGTIIRGLGSAGGTP